MEPEIAGQAIANVAALLGALLFVVAYPDLLDAAAAALLGGYCPGPGAGNILYLLPLMLLFGAAFTK